MTRPRGNDSLRRKSGSNDQTTELTFTCACGKTYRVPISKVAAGARFKCQACGRKISPPPTTAVEFGGAADPQRDAPELDTVRSRAGTIPGASTSKPAARGVPEPADLTGKLQSASASTRTYRATFAAIVALTLLLATGLYFHFAPEDWARVTAVFRPDHDSTGQASGDSVAVNASKSKNPGIGFDLNDIEKTKSWALKFGASVEAVDDHREQVKAGEMLEKVKPKLDALAGAEIRWQLPVKSISEFFVVLDGDLDGLMLAQARSKDETILSEFSRTAAKTTGENVIQLTIEKHISREDASRLRPGDKLPIVATIDIAGTGFRTPAMGRAARAEGKPGQAFFLYVAIKDVLTPAIYEVARQPAIKLSIADLQAAFANELTGRQLYEGKRIQVSGVPELTLASDVLRDPNNKKHEIKCQYETPLAWELRGKPFLVLTVLGICRNDGVLTGCKILTTNEEVQAQIKRNELAGNDERNRVAEALENEVRNTPAISSGEQWVVGEIREVEGKVNQVRSGDPNGSISLFLTFEGTDTRLRCSFRPKHQAQLAALKAGTSVRVKGKYVSYGHLDGCVFPK